MTTDFECPSMPTTYEGDQGALDTPRTPLAKKDLLTPAETADELRVSAEQVRCLIRRGELTAVNVGTGSKRPLYRITRRALDEFMAGRYQPSPAVRPARITRRQPVHDHFPDLR
jgi:excisionase family DNA binding protein